MNTLSHASTDSASSIPMFYVVSVRKLVVMNIASLGFYWLFWSLRNWDLYWSASGKKFMFLPRAALPELFLYSLLRKVDQRIRESGRAHRWSPWSLAFGAITTALLCWTMVLLPLPLATAVQVILAVVLAALNLMIQGRIQRAINFYECDPQGAGNAQFTLVNWLWISLFALGWLILAAVKGQG